MLGCGGALSSSLLSLHHVAGVVAVLCTPTLRYSSADDPGQKVWPTPLLSSSAVPAPSLGVIMAVFFGCLCLPLFFQLPLPH